MKKQILITVIPIYTVGFLFNTIFSLIAIIIPLYGLYAGYSATQIGLLLSIPGLLQVFLRMFTGVLSDRFGEKRMLAFTYCLTIFSSVIFTFSLGFLTLAFFQIINGTTRAIFWPTSQSYASRISSAESSSILGKFHSFNEGGKIFGILFAGWAIVNIGYLGTFRLIAVIGILGLIIVGFMKSIPLASGERAKIKNIGLSFNDLAKIPPLQFAFITAFSAGLLVALTQSFFPIWLKKLGNTEGIISIILASYSVGSILAGRFFAKMHEKMRFPFLLQLSFAGVGTGFLLVAVVTGSINVFILTSTVGFFAGIIAVSYQVMVVSNSAESNRGFIMSFVGLGWGVAFLLGPTLFGLLVDGLSITVAFSLLGFLILLYAMFMKTLYSHFMGLDQKEQNVSLIDEKAKT
ncbi:MAG: hypothetical protein APF84_02335 [Gracilibacter sp. BRH_c7a]|nr:MAG: hypothetical protein APF84_02335 [Gracilibacter sp. BRH_c7a]